MLLVPQKTPGISQSGPFLIIIQSVHLHFSHYGGASKHIMDDIQFVDTFNFLICYFFWQTLSEWNQCNNNDNNSSVFSYRFHRIQDI